MSLGFESEFSSKFSSNTRQQCRYPYLESSLLGAVAARWNEYTHTLSKQRSHNSSTTKRTVMADFGQTDFGQPNLASPFWRPSLAKPTLASVSVLVVWPTLAKTCSTCVVCLCVCVCAVYAVLARVLVSRFHGVGVSRVGVGFKVLVSSCLNPRRPPGDRDPAAGPPGLHTTTRELQTCTFERPGVETTKFPREDPQRRKKRTNFAAREGKQSAKFWAPHPSNHHFLGPWGPTLLHPPTTTQNTQKKLNIFFKKKKPKQFTPKKPKSLHTTNTLTLAKVGLAKVGLA